MAGLKEQVWVTSAVVAEDVEKALVLCFSLRRAYTTRKIAVIASTNLSMNHRNSLNLGFDYVFYLMEDQNLANLKLDDFAKLYSLLALKPFDNCVYVSPSMVAVKNCDDIFSTETDGIVLVKGDENASIFLFKPSLDNFVGLTNGLMNALGKGAGFTTYLKNWIEHHFQDAEFLDQKINVQCIYENIFLSCDNDICSVKIMHLPRGSNTEALNRTGILGNLVAIYYEKIRSYEVLPLLNPINNMVDPSPLPPILSYRKEPIAIVGMSCRYPGSNNLEEFWNLLIQGQDGTSNHPAFRWRREQSVKNLTDAMKTNAGFLKAPVDEFDAKFFGISPKEVVFMDPQHRLLHEVVWEALEDACIDTQTLRGTSGSVFMGSWINDYKDILMHSENSEFYRGYMGNSIGAATARLSFLLGLTGPSIATESGCSSSMVAVHLACRSLQSGETNLALAGGVNLLLHPFNKDIMPLVVSPDGHCRTFSEDANGFARAEGCGVLVLKRLSDALKDGDKIWAIIRGSAVAQEGISNSMGTPTVHCETLAMKDALKDARVRPEEVSYVEAHGTGTVVGDPMEVTAISKAYHSSARKTPLVIGSVKTNVGHTESCSGITGIMKVVLSMLHETIPTHQNFTKLNPSIDLEAIPAVIPLESMEWKKRKGVPRIAGVSSFGITGTDAHVILEESPELPDKVLAVNGDLDRPLHLVKISAKTEEGLEILLGKYRDKMQSCQESLSDIAFSSNIGRANFAYRAAIIARTKEDAVYCIDQRKFINGEVSADFHGKICFLFTGQGSQYPGMAKRLYDCSPVFQVHFDYCSRIFKDNYISLEDIIWGSNSGTEEDINRSIYSQPSIFCVEYALLKLWESWGVKPDYALGHSMGEFAAAFCAGIISVEDAIKLVAWRSKLIDALPRGKMLVIQADQNEVEKKMKTFAGGDPRKLLDYAAINSSSQTVVAGDSYKIMEFSKFCTENQLKCRVLPATHAFHSKHMDPMLEKYRDVAKTTKALRAQTCEYISGLRGNLVSNESINAEYWVQHTREKVNFLKASQKAVELGCNIFIEIGPQPVLSALTMMNNDTDLLCLSSLKRKEDDWVTILNTVGKLYVKGIEIDWNGFDQFYNRNKVRLPHYPFIGKRFWPDLMHMTGNAIHPLIGSVLPNASSVKIFQSGLNSSTQPYIRDHTIGQTVVFPGAGYLEMCIAAGLATVEGSTNALGKPSRTMKIENLIIKAPLALQEEKTTQLQTVVELNVSTDDQNYWNGMNVKIFHRQEDKILEKWLEHAVATFSPLPTAEEQMISFDVEYFQETILRPSKSEEIPQVYDKLASIGLKFGPIFRSLEKVWRSEENHTLVAKVKVPEITEGQRGQYIVHPVVLDAMMQAILMLKLTSNAKTKLFVPIQIGKFLWMSNPTCESTDIYIHVYENPLSVSVSSSSSCTALLLDAHGKIMALMTEVEFIETTVKAVEAVLEQQTSTMPDLWEETWRPSIGPSQHRHDLALCRKERFYDDEYLKNLKRKYNKLSPEKHEAFLSLEHLVYLNFLRCLYDCGWEPTINASFTVESLAEKLGILAEYIKMLNYILEVLEEEGILQNVGPATWKVIAIPPSITEIQEELSPSTYTTDLVKIFKPTLLIAEVGKNYSAIFRGTQSVLPIMFPEDPKKSKVPPVADFYKDYGQLSGVVESCVDVAHADMKHFKATTSGQKNILRILEVGAGTGIFTQSYLQVLKGHNIEMEYTFTDISPAFFPAAEKALEPYLKSLTFKKLNIEEDPASQGFIPNYYDCVIASDVIHATKNLRETFTNVRSLLRSNGKFMMVEQTRKNRIITFLFGLLDGFWRFEDADLRPDHCTLSVKKWKEALELAAFDVLEAFPCVQNYHSFLFSYKTENTLLNSNSAKFISSELQKYWILFHQDDSPTSKYLLEQIATTTNRNVIIVRRGKKYKSVTLEKGTPNFELRQDSEQDFVDLMDAVEDYCGQNLEGIIYAWSLDKACTSQNSILQPFFYLTKSFLRKIQSSTAKLISLVNGIMSVEDNDLSHFHFSTIWGFIKTLRNERIDVDCRCIDIGGRDEVIGAEQIFYELWSSSKDTQVVYHDNTRYTCKLQALKPNLVDLKLPNGTDRFQLILPETKSFADLQFGALEPFILKEDEIEIQVVASALNFRDVFSVLKPSDAFKDINAVGFDFAGILKRVGSKVSHWSVGDRVFGLNMRENPLPSHIQLHEKDVLPMPDGMTFAEACTLPAVVATSHYCLVEVAKITAGDTVLIHAASGGVGLSAIQICKNVGATIIATAGSKRKQNYLRSLGIEHIFHSRNTDYGDEILRVTNGRGVDVVLNSLTSEGFKEATLKACAKNARFVEMSKLSIWQPEEVKQLRPDVDYTIADLSSMENDQLRALMKAVYDLIVEKAVTPIPYVRFDAVHIPEALQYLQKAKHIGKVVVVMPEIRLRNGNLNVHTPMFNENATYLITGGLGGIGFVVCQWMVEKGAKNIVLAGRSLPSDKIISSIDDMRNETGANILPVQLDISDFEKCKELIEVKIGEMGLPPLKGVMHAAGTIQDGLIENQTWEKLSSTFKAKVDGTLNLHELTQNLNLEHFVLFSSMAATLGSPGQCNHAAGNMFEDTFAHYRHSIGLPATTVNWGQWGEVGIATEVDFPGAKPLSNLQGTAGLEFAMKSQRSQTGIFNIDSFFLLSKLFPQILNILDERVLETSGNGNSSGHINMISNEFWQQYDNSKRFEERSNIIKEKLKSFLRNILKLEDADVIDDNGNFQEMGVDSLMFVEMKNAIQALFGNRATVSVNAMKDCNTVNLLADALMKIIEGGSIEEEKLPTAKEVAALIQEDCQLPQHITAKPDQIKVDVKDVSKILLTGCSGTLGPYTLKELSNTPQVTEIVCLMRPNKSASGMERLQKILKDRDLLSDIDLTKVRCVNGNVAMPNIGLEPIEWEELCNSVDAVFHCAASVQHVEHYRKRDSDSDMRAVNVQGTRNILEFACTGGKLKQVYCASSMLAVTTVSEDGHLSEDWPDVNDYDGVTTIAYPITKFVGDVLMKQAILERGIPGKVFRFPFIVGDSQTGRFVLDKNHVMLRYMFILQQGIMPSNPFPLPMLPVDTCAWASVNIFFNQKAPDDIFNVSNITPAPEQEFVSVAEKLGYKVDIVDFREFSEKLRNSTPDDSPFAIFKDFYQNDENILSLYNTSSALKEYVLRGGSDEKFMVSKKITPVLPEFYDDIGSCMDHIYRDMLFAKSQGWFSKFNLK